MRVDDAALRDRGQCEADEGAEGSAVLRHDLEGRVAAIVVRRQPWSIQASAIAVRVDSVPQSGGGGASTVQLWLAGVRSWFPAASVARTWNVWAPTLSPVRSTGEVQAANAAASSLHSKVDGFSLAENAKDALVLIVVAGGPESIVVCGASCQPARP